MPDNYLNRLNPNLVVILHFLGKLLWIGLACLFALVGYNLYKIGLDVSGNAEIDVTNLFSISLENAGPGLIVMVFALACSVVGVTRSKVTLKLDEVELQSAQTITPNEENEITKSEIKIFANLAKDYADREYCAFAVINDQGSIVLESVGWNTIHSDIRKKIINSYLAKRKSVDSAPEDYKSTIEEWIVIWKPIILNSNTDINCAIFATPQVDKLKRDILRKEVGPIYINA